MLPTVRDSCSFRVAVKSYKTLAWKLWKAGVAAGVSALAAGSVEGAPLEAAGMVSAAAAGVVAVVVPLAAALGEASSWAMIELTVTPAL